MKKNKMKKDKIRCPWLNLSNEDYVKYHDEEWGIPVHNDKTHFEFLILEGAQAGLSWTTILSRRKAYKKAYSNFNVKKVAQYDKRKIEELIKNEGIIRNRLKIESSINNAKLFLEIQKEFGSFDQYVWGFVKNKVIKNIIRSKEDYVATTPESDALALDLKKRGFKFCGSTIMYAYMQACGLVNDHASNCFCRKRKL